MRRGVVGRFVAFPVFLACLVAGCGSGSDGGPSSRSSIDPVGSWSGSTSQEYPFSFVVTSDGITTVSLSWHLSGSVCSSDAEASASGTRIAIHDNAFSVDSLLLGPGIHLSATGQFTSSDAASGTFQISDTNCKGALNGSWTASKT